MSSDISKQSYGSPKSFSRLAIVKPLHPAPMMQVLGFSLVVNAIRAQ